MNKILFISLIIFSGLYADTHNSFNSYYHEQMNEFKQMKKSMNKEFEDFKNGRDDTKITSANYEEIIIPIEIEIIDNSTPLEY